MTTLVTAQQLLLQNGLLAEPVLIFEDGVIASVATRSAQALPPHSDHHDYPGAILAPAYFDVHTHGCRGRDVMEATPEALATVGSFLATCGVGAYLATTMTAPREAILRSLSGLAKLLSAPPLPGHARPLGLHIEGPFLSHAKRGAHPTRDLLEPSTEFFDAMWAAAEGRIVLMTIAPELPGALDLIAHAVSLGVKISIGHSDGWAADAHAAVRHGAVSATHTFNAMHRLDHREPGLLGAVLSTDSLYAELICDGIHVDPSIVQLFSRAKPADRAILITDAMSAAGMPDGSYKLGELDVRVTDGRAILGENTLAGSTLTMADAVPNYMRFAGIPLAQAVRAAGQNPARMTQLSSAATELTAGHRADFNVLAPDGALQATYLGGRRVQP
jgi:N-acetylglucosamine-6-phosphate deacetylase